MSTLREHAFNIFVIDPHDAPVPGAQVEVLIGGAPAAMATTRSSLDAAGVARGVANAPVSVHLPDAIADIRIRVTYAGEVQEQAADLDAPNLTFRMGAASRGPGGSIGPGGHGGDAGGPINLTALREGIVREFSREELIPLYQDLDAALKDAGHIEGVSADDVAGSTKPVQVAELIGFFQRRTALPVLIDGLERQRPGFATRVGAVGSGPASKALIMRGGPPAATPSATPSAAPAAAPVATPMRPVSVTPRIRLAEVATSIYELLLKDGWPLVSIDLVNQQATPFAGSLTVALQRFSDDELHDIDLEPHAATSIDVHPVLLRREIDALQELERVTLQVRLDALDNRTVSRNSVSLYLLPRSAAPLSVKDLMSGTWRDLRPYLGGYVTPQAKAVQALLNDVRRLTPGQQLVGYGGAPSDVEPQVRAVFEALHALGVGYVHSTLVFNRHEDWSRQRLRLPSETLALKVANCLDGTVLVASLLEAFGLNAALVFTGTGESAHAFVAWETYAGSGVWANLETTGFTTMTFEDARASADAKAAAFEATNAATPNPIFCRLPVRDLRAKGIAPLE
jgi:hypothetical protein